MVINQRTMAPHRQGLRWLVLVLASLTAFASYAGTGPLRPAIYHYPTNSPEADELVPGMGAFDAGDPDYGNPAFTGRIDGFALGGGEPEVRARFNVVGSGGIHNVASTLFYSLQVVPVSEDPFGQLVEVPIRIPFAVSLVAVPRDARVSARVAMDVEVVPDGTSFPLLEYKACGSDHQDSSNPQLRCFGQFPANMYETAEGTVRIHVASFIEHSIHLIAQVTVLCATDPCEGLASAYLDPLPVLDDSVPPAQLGRPPGWRLADYYRLEFSANGIVGPRTGMYGDGFE